MFVDESIRNNIINQNYLLFSDNVDNNNVSITHDCAKTEHPYSAQSAFDLSEVEIRSN